MPFMMMLIVDVLLGLLFGGFAHGICSLFHQGQTKFLNLALGFLMGAILVGGLMCLAGMPRAMDIYNLFWPLPVASGLFSLTLTSTFWSKIGEFLSGPGYSPTSNSSGFTSNNYYGYDERNRYERDRERRYWGE